MRVLVLEILDHLTLNHGYMTTGELRQEELAVARFIFDPGTMVVTTVFDELTEL